MKLLPFRPILSLAAACALAFSSGSAWADTVNVTYLVAGVQSQTNTPSVTYYAETFDNGLPGGTTTFGGSGITGTYTSTANEGYTIHVANSDGGAGGTGSYFDLFSADTRHVSSATLALSGSIDYFGLWISAADSGDTMQFYNGSTLVYTFTGAQLLQAVGDCAPRTAICGNPNPQFLGQGTQPFVFVNFNDTDGTFNKIVFSEANGFSGFESDNHTVAVPPPPPPVVTPEPSSLILISTGALGVVGMLRRRLKK